MSCGGRAARTKTTRSVILLACAAAGVAACTSGAPPAAPHVARRPTAAASSAASPPLAAGTLGVRGSFLVGTRRMTFIEPPHAGPTGEQLGRRVLATVIRYPLARPVQAGRPAHGRFPLLVFAPGFTECPGPYGHLLQAWASAGYVVAGISFPRTDCHVGAAAYEADLVNQPADMSYVITRLLAMSGRPGDLFSGLLNSHQVAAAGQSDGGDTVAALAAASCCADHRLVAAAVLSGAEWPPMPGRYFAGPAPPMIFVQGSADTINPPWTSKQLYRADSPRARFYLDLFGASHTIPYFGTDPVERLVARVTLAFFDRYVLGKPEAAAVMAADGDVPGRAKLASAGQPPP
ncbi:MAG: alpha/beta hydrolase family protein [Streptosporangiaceae bacterium]